MRLDHLLSKEELVGDCFTVQESRDSDFLVSNRTKKRSFFQCTFAESIILLVVIRYWVTPVLIPNTMVKTLAADGTILVTIWESR